MKKLLALALVTVLALSLLTACGGSNNSGNSGSSGGASASSGNNSTGTPSGGNNAPSGSNSTSSPAGNNSGGNAALSPADVNFGAIMGGGAGNFSNLSPIDRQAMIDAGKAEGIDVTFEADGSVKFVDEDGTVAVQKPDGTWVIETDDGTMQFQIGGNWPDNEYTKMIPKPDFNIYTAVDSEESFAAMFQGATIEQIKSYVEKVKAAGFTIDAETEDEEMMGMVMYTYTAQNAGGYTISVYSMSGSAGINVEKPYN
jgi:hypothetical protein